MYEASSEHKNDTIPPISSGWPNLQKLASFERSTKLLLNKNQCQDQVQCLTSEFWLSKSYQFFTKSLEFCKFCKAI